MRVSSTACACFQMDIWRGVGEGYAGSPSDELQVEVFQPWLEAAQAISTGEPDQPHVSSSTAHSHSHSHGHDHAHHTHDHDDHGAHAHDHGDHVHEERQEVERRAAELEGEDDKSKLTKALLKVPHCQPARIASMPFGLRCGLGLSTRLIPIPMANQGQCRIHV